MGNYIQDWEGHESDFHNVTQYGSKMCHATVTGMTCDSAPPPLGRALRGHEKERKNMYVHVRVRLEKGLEKLGKSLEKSQKKVLGKVRKKSKSIHKNITSCLSKREKKKNFFCYFP